MNSKDDLLDELYQVRDSFVPVTHFLTGRKLRDENKQRAHIKKSLNCFHLIGKCFFFWLTLLSFSKARVISDPWLVSSEKETKSCSQYYSSKALQRVNKTSCLQLSPKPLH